MITYKRCKEIFNNEKRFALKEYGTGINYTRVIMHNLSKKGEHYEFGYRRMPNGFNDVAEVFFSKWTSRRSWVVCHNICDEKFLLTLIDECWNNGNF